MHTVKQKYMQFVHMCYFAFTMSEKNSRSFPIRVSEELYAELEEVRKLTGYSQQDLARLALRIGLVDLRASKDIAQVIQEAATDKGASFLAYARQQLFRLDAAKDESAPVPPRQEITNYRAGPAKKPRSTAGGGTSPSLDGRMVAEEHEK